MANVFNKPEIELIIIWLLFGKLDIRNLFIDSIVTFSVLQYCIFNKAVVAKLNL